jgi:hypothetical protein
MRALKVQAERKKEKNVEWKERRLAGQSMVI